jgi:condensation domain-containing protein
MADGRTQPVCHTYEIVGPLDTERLAAALQALAVRHDALRMIFPRRADEPVYAECLDTSAGRWPLRIITIAEGTASERDAQAQRLLEEFCSDPIDLERGPLASALLLHLSPGRHVLTLALEHLICDGAALAQLMAELPELYDADAPALAAAESFIAYAEHSRSADGETALRRNLTFWQRDFDEHGMFPPLLRPTPELAPDPTAVGASATVTVPVPDEVAAMLPAVAAGRRVTPFMIYLASVLYGLRPWLESDWIGTVFMESGRRDRSTQHLVGNLAHELQVWCEVGADADFSDLLRQVPRRLISAIGHSIPLWWVTRRYRSGPSAVQQFSPEQFGDRFATPWLFFACQSGGVVPELPGLQIAPFPRRVEIPFMRTPVVMVNVAETPHGTALICDFARSGYREAAVREALRRSVAALTDLVAEHTTHSAGPAAGHREEA